MLSSPFGTPASASRWKHSENWAAPLSRWKASLRRHSTAPVLASPSPSHWPNCMAAPCGCGPLWESARWWWCACHYTGRLRRATCSGRMPPDRPVELYSDWVLNCRWHAYHATRLSALYQLQQELRSAAGEKAMLRILLG